MCLGRQMLGDGEALACLTPVRMSGDEPVVLLFVQTAIPEGLLAEGFRRAVLGSGYMLRAPMATAGMDLNRLACAFQSQKAVVLRFKAGVVFG